MVDMVHPGSRDQDTEADRLARESAAAFRVAEATPDVGDKAAALREARKLAGDSALAAAYIYLQRVVGIIAVSLPAAVAIGNMLFDGVQLKGSISAYYYTPVGGVFVGALCALAVFFLSYNYRPLPNFEADNVLSTLACVAAVGVALLPTTSDAATASGSETAVAVAHLGCAAALFVLMAIFSLVLFTLSDDEEMTAEKARRNAVYRACGAVIVAVIALVLASNVVDPPSSWHTLFWLESVGVVAFGVSWLVKGFAWPLWADRPHRGA
jgi:heme A synthase